MHPHFWQADNGRRRFVRLSPVSDDGPVPGMGSGSHATSSPVVAAFHHALWQQFLIVLLLAAGVGAVRAVLRSRQLRAAAGGGLGSSSHDGADPAATSPPAVRLLRLGFGLLWLLDGILQGQAAMPLGMPLRIMEPAAAGSPRWVHDLVHFAASTWIEHPVTAAAAAVWIQVGIGLALLVAPPGAWSRLAGATAAGWGLVVWVFGEAFGGVLARGDSWLFGAPGAAALYVVAGVLVALPERAWQGPAAGRWMLRSAGAFFLGMAALQAWPGRGFWHGAGPGTSGQLAAMVRSMARTRQPAPLASLLRAFAGLAADHGWAVNLAAVVALALAGAALVVSAARPRPAAWAVGATALVCLADWVLVQDLGFFGGMGTDPNTMVPLVLLVTAGWVALVHPAPAEQSAGASLPRRRSVRSVLAAPPGYLLRVAAVLAAFGVVLLGAVPMTVASASRSASPVVARAPGRPPVAEHSPAPGPRLLLEPAHPSGATP